MFDVSKVVAALAVVLVFVGCSGEESSQLEESCGEGSAMVDGVCVENGDNNAEPDGDNNAEPDENNADPCADVGCAAPPTCAEGCTAECGCCNCGEGSDFCGESGATLMTCNLEEGCFEEAECESGECLDGEDGAQCGEVDPCAEVECAPTPSCGEECTAECGCCGCEAGSGFCSEDNSAIICDTEGACLEAQPCGDETCVEDAEAASCVDLCADVECAPTPQCGVACDAQCGCCECQAGEARCVDEDTLSTCGIDGACLSEERCPNGCFDPEEEGEPARCLSRDDCGVIEAEYLELVNASQNQRCSEQSDCSVINGHCGVGLGGCYYGLNIEQRALDAIALRWTQAGCRGPVCRCTAPPSVRCDGGGCLLTQRD